MSNPQTSRRVPLTWSRYRIIRDDFAGYEAQIKRWWWPFWKQINGTNTHKSLELAEAFCRRHAVHGATVRYLGRLPKSIAGWHAIQELERIQKERAT